MFRRTTEREPNKGKIEEAPHGPRHLLAQLQNTKLFFTEDDLFVVYEAINKYGKEKGSKIAFAQLVAGLRAYTIEDLEVAKRVIQNREGIFRKGEAVKTIAKSFMGAENLVGSDELWEYQKEFFPAGAEVNAHAVAIVDAIIERFLIPAFTEQDVLMTDLAKKMTLSIGTQYIISEDLPDFETDLEHFFKHVAFSKWRSMVPKALLSIFASEKLKSYDFYLARVRKVFHALVEKRKQVPADQRPRDFLSQVVAYQTAEKTQEMVKNGVLSKDCGVDQLMTMEIASSDTSSTIITAATYLLAQHPDKQRRLITEIRDYLQGRKPELKDLKHMPYLEAVMSETMRLYTPADLVREVGQETVIDVMENGVMKHYRVPKGALLRVPLRLLHRDPSIFIDAEEFIPERFIENETDQPEVPKSAFSPFGGGKRVCYGQNLGRYMIMRTLCEIYQNTDGMEFFNAPEDGDISEFHLTLTTQSNLQGRFIPRQEERVA